ncbi:O-antigen ligase family protein [Novosphingobium sp. PASSN1]|uniref:O-antigen ligase family protein n=1 Tax=Novosphingobium sp. PASSN1 TaxID=2015561 RepID=UPI0025F88835|nr:O-antigen ligase family protein [Novosphingobium sp. PASSN1]
MVMVALAIGLGGGGTVNPQTEMLLQFLIALLLLPLTISSKWQRGLGAIPRAMLLLAGLILVLPVLQLIPLPPSIWHALPGRTIELQSLTLVQAGQTWMPLTMAPSRTFASLLAMLCPVLLMLQVSRLSLRGRNWLCVTITVGAVLSLVLGVLQLSHTGGWSWSLYSQFSEGYLVGFQANHNAEADFLLISILAMGVLVTTRLGDGRHHGLTWVGFLFILLALVIGLLMTGSRTGIALGLPILALLGFMLWPMLRNKKTARWGLGGIVGALVIGGAAISQLQSVQKVIARFFLTKEARWDLWADTWFAIHQVWPIGSGIGTIVPMLEAAERLDVVDPSRPVRAHNDWLEWILEGGLPGVILLGLVIIIIATVAIRAFMEASRAGSPPARRAQVIFGCGVLIVCGLHSIVDYPLRSMALATLAAIAVALLVTPAAVQRSSS